MIKIDKNIPIPVIRGKKYPLGMLEVGESFFSVELKNSNLGGRGQFHLPKKFSCRTVTENGVKGVRVWRVL